MARRLRQIDIDATRADADEALRMRMSRGGEIDKKYGPAGGETSIGGGGPGEDAPALRAIASAFRDVQRGGLVNGRVAPGFAEDNPYVQHATEASQPGMGGTMGGGDFQNMRELALGRRANDVFAYENAKKRASGLLGVRRQ